MQVRGGDGRAWVLTIVRNRFYDWSREQKLKGAVSMCIDRRKFQIFAITDDIAERVRKIGGLTLRSIGNIARLQTLKDNNEQFVAPLDMLRELMNDNKALIAEMREAHEIADKHEDVATTSLLENYIDEAERRTWFLFEASRKGDGSGH